MFKKVKIITFLLFIAVIACAGCGSDSSSSSGNPNSGTLVSGYCYDANTNKTIYGYWKDGEWIGLTNPYSIAYATYLSAIAVNGSDVYVSGSCPTTSLDTSGSGGYLYEAGYWKNGQWVPLPNSYGSTYTSYDSGWYYSRGSIIISGSDVYMTGVCYFASTATPNYCTGYTRMPGYWKNETWQAITNSYGSTSLYTYNWIPDSLVADSSGNVYILGNCIGSYVSSGTTYYVNTPGYWKNGTWTPLSNSYGSTNPSYAECLVINGTDIYVAGESYNPATGVASYVAGYWKNGSWTALTNSYGAAYSAYVDYLAVNGTDVYVAGYAYGVAGSASNYYYGYWKNGSWTALQNGYSSIYYGSYTSVNFSKTGFVINGNDIFVGGTCTNTSSKTYYCYWKNGTWTEVANPNGSSYAYTALIGNLAISGSDVYIGGRCENKSQELAGYWKNATWTALTNPYRANDEAYINNLTQNGSNLYAAGQCWNYIEGAWVAGYWTNWGWTSLTNPYGPYTAIAQSFIVQK